ncbi:hypothetical protein [Comamonas odontotermitis]|uniref:hypothetical protein n=1 Tax=Comamonas TaxID=283 RepID=UPI001CC80C82|nr:hypothetical protein [Comamonas odontotermitis]UBB19172.1 hypothetical protein LAD35_13300 [Comamonas odontotermitis]
MPTPIANAQIAKMCEKRRKTLRLDGAIILLPTKTIAEDEIRNLKNRAISLTYAILQLFK